MNIQWTGGKGAELVKVDGNVALNDVYDLGVFDCSIAMVRFRFCNSIPSIRRNAVLSRFVSRTPLSESTLLPIRHLLPESDWPSRVPGDFLRNILFYPL